ncbi:PilZ domain-containing protein [Oceanispirochaeta sp.]|uniref:PilZ domain-containing protein n=1 Tax=Oceanispirochaeta sp. TaxID=2035350 RepID=UPI002616F1B1|nr:PilZ domain-containing protein [Oceanispirochaeta sp.]MDA3957901.1 PilZ domain-containing protein [Oceanispirochaeta sp.]
MSKERTDQRNQSYAKVLLDNSQPAYIRDISARGFRVYSPVPLPYKEGSTITCLIIPTDSEGQSFKISGEIRWNKLDAEGEDIMGILISSFEDKKGESLYHSLNMRFSKKIGSV